MAVHHEKIQVSLSILSKNSNHPSLPGQASINVETDPAVPSLWVRVASPLTVELGLSSKTSWIRRFLHGKSLGP